MKRIIAFMLTVLCIISMASCGKKSNLGDEGGEDSGKELKSKTKYNFLVMGHDREASLTDVIMIVSYDKESGEMSLMQIPRDTYISVDGESYSKANGLYNHFVSEAKKDESKDPKLEGCTRTAEYLGEALGIRIHYSAVMDLDGFGAIVDAIGGVYMYVPYSMEYNDPDQNLYINLPEGYNTLDGNESEQFVRFRSGLVNADLGRVDAQKMFMTAFIESVKKNISLSNVATIASAIIKNVKTDMRYREIVEIGTSLLDIELSAITMMTVPGEVASSYYVINKECLKDVLNESFNIYAEDLTEDDVDKNAVFLDEGISAMKAVYEKPAEEISFEKHNAQDVSDEDIYVPLK